LFQRRDNRLDQLWVRLRFSMRAEEPHGAPFVRAIFIFSVPQIQLAGPPGEISTIDYQTRLPQTARLLLKNHSLFF
jgi:hypothetical protein